LLVDGDRPPYEIDVPKSVRLVDIQAASATNESPDRDGEAESPNEVVIARRKVILSEFELLKPRVVIVDGFPFSQQQRRGELLPLIERARNGIYGESLVVCTTDAIVIDELAGSEGRADVAAAVLEKYFDLIIVQSDPVFARLEEFFRPRNTLHTPSYHTGFVLSEPGSLPEPGDEGGKAPILVSAGDGRHGGVLFRAAIETQRVLWPVTTRPMRLIAGPRLAENEYQELLARANGMRDVSITRRVENLAAEMSRAHCSVSQCDYAVALSTISTRIPSLFVPCQGSQHQEQMVRAQRLAYWGAGRLLLPHHLNSASLSNEISQLQHLEVRMIRFDTSGAAKAAKLIDRALHSGDAGSRTMHPAGRGPCPY